MQQQSASQSAVRPYYYAAVNSAYSTVWCSELQDLSVRLNSSGVVFSYIGDNEGGCIHMGQL